MAYYSSGYLVTDARQSDAEASELTTEISSLPTNTSVDVTVYQDKSGGTTADNSESFSVSDGTTKYSLSNFTASSGANYWARFDLSTSDSSSTPSVDAVTFNFKPEPPSSVSLSYVADDSLDLTVDAPSTWGDSIGSYEIRMERDGSGYNTTHGGPSNPSGSTSTQTYNYGPSSDSEYQKQVGIDSSFKFRVRAKNSAGTSSWTTSETIRTTPAPPTDVNVNRPDANTLEITFTGGADASSNWRVLGREDTGSGYSGWNEYAYDYGSAGKGTTKTVTLSVANGDISKDARYQFKIKHFFFQNSTRFQSDAVYADYGNKNNVFFEDGLESGDLSAWSGDRRLDDADSGVQSGSHSDLGINSADEGTYYLRLDATDYVATPDFDGTTSSSSLIVRAVVATGSMDSASQNTKVQVIDRNDGDGWHTIESFSHKYNKQGWTQITTIIPSTHVSSSMSVRFKGYSDEGDHFAVDSVAVSDILHEYTKPAAPSALSLDTSTKHEISATWTANASLHGVDNCSDRAYLYLDGTQEKKNYPGLTESETFNSLLDGEEYEVIITTVQHQDRHGAGGNNYWTSNQLNGFATTFFPIDTPSASADSDTSLSVSWSDVWNNEDGIRVHYSSNSGSTWTQFSDLAAGTNSEVITGLTQDTEYTIKIEPYTEHVSKDSGTDTAITYLNELRLTSSHSSSITSGVESLISLDVDASSYSKPMRSGSARIVNLLALPSSHTTSSVSASERSSVGYEGREPNSHCQPINHTIFNERTSLEVVDYNLNWNRDEVAWYTEWFQEERIMGNEDVLSVRSLVVDDAKEPAATITVQYNSDGDGIVDDESEPIDTCQDEEVHDVRGVPVDEGGWYRLKITNYTGYNEIYTLDIGMVR